MTVSKRLVERGGGKAWRRAVMIFRRSVKYRKFCQHSEEKDMLTKDDQGAG